MSHIQPTALPATFPIYDDIPSTATSRHHAYLQCVQDFLRTPDADNKVELQMAHHALICALYEPGSMEAEQQARDVRGLLEWMTRY